MPHLGGRARYLLISLALIVVTAGIAGAGGGVVGQYLEDRGYNQFQIDAFLGNGWDVSGATQMYGFADDPLGPPGILDSSADGAVPVRIGVEMVRFTDPALVPPPVDAPVIQDGALYVPFGDGPMRPDVVYAQFWAEMAAPIPYNTPGIGLNIAWPSFVEGHDRWMSPFPGDSFTGASHIPVFFNNPASGDPLAWVADVFMTNGTALNPYQGPGGLAWVQGTYAGMYVPMDAFANGVPGEISEYGFASDFTIQPESQFDPNAPRKVTVYPANFGADGREGGLRPVDYDKFILNVGFEPLVDPVGARVFRDPFGDLWVNLTFLNPWPIVDTIQWFIANFHSLGLQYGLGINGSVNAFFGTDFHDGEHSLFGSGPEGEVTPPGITVMNDGSVNLHLGVPWDEVADGSDPLTVFVGTAFWLDEQETERQSVLTEFPVDRSTVAEEDPGGDGVTTYPAFDIVTGESIPPPVAPTTTTSSTTTTTTTTTSTTTTTTTTLPPTTTGGGETSTPGLSTRTDQCWWCWGIVTLFLAILLCILYVWLKTYEWWTCWLPWFLVIFIWVPFLLAGLWWWRPAWWWVPLLAWFPLVAGYAWYWARHRSWWRPWHLYLVGGYLAVLIAGVVAVGDPEWGLLLPAFWLPWVGFYLWFRGSRQPWFRSWMWLLAAGYVAWVFIWVAALSPWWAWWLPVLFIPFVGWWLFDHGYDWQVVHGPKWCWVVPFAALPFLAWWILLWGPWWCLVVALFAASTVFCAIFNHYKEQEWWTCWLPWFLVGFVWVPFLLAGLWFFRPNWWWLALLPWFVIVPGYAWWWGRRRSWWMPWMWGAVLGYLGAAGILMVVVGAPEWGLLLPVFWLPWAGLYLWYRGMRQPWWRPWLLPAFLGYGAAVFLWLANLTPFWGWWFPAVFLPVLGWWYIDHGYDRALMRRKSCFIIPWGLLPWLCYMTAIYAIPAYYGGL